LTSERRSLSAKPRHLLADRVGGARPAMRIIPALLALLVVAEAAAANSPSRTITADGVRFNVPAGWHRVPAAPAGPVVDPRTLLVVGTVGVRPRASQCQIAAYRIPATGAVVVVAGWSSVAAGGGGHLKPGRGSLARLRNVRRPSFECFSGRGAAAQVLLRGKPYQVNVMVGDHASKRTIMQAFAVGRSFRLAR
jgi:hypothetical protein